MAKLEKLVSIHNQDEWLIAVDLCGSRDPGSDSTSQSSSAEVISGLSLPLALRRLITRTA